MKSRINLLNIIKDNEGIRIMKILLKDLNINAPTHFIREKINIQPYRNAFINIVNVVPEFNLDSLLIKLNRDEFNQVNDFNFPFVGLLSNEDKSYCAIISKIEDGNVSYKTIYGKITETWDLFAKKWSGNALLLFPEESEKKEYNRSKFTIFDLDILNIGITIVFLTLFLSGFSWLYFKSDSILLPLLWLFKIIGIYLSTLLILHGFNQESSLVSKFCNTYRSDCNQILNNKDSKLFNIIEWSYLGFLYFFGTGVEMLIGANDLVSLGAIMFLFNIVCVLFSFYSLWYQAIKTKQWCYFCLATLFIFYIEFFILLQFDQYYNIRHVNIVSLFSTTISFIISIFVLYYLIIFFGQKKHTKNKKRH